MRSFGQCRIDLVKLLWLTGEHYGLRFANDFLDVLRELDACLLGEFGATGVVAAGAGDFFRQVVFFFEEAADDGGGHATCADKYDTNTHACL